jgi:hypothetical protein
MTAPLRLPTNRFARSVSANIFKWKKSNDTRATAEKKKITQSNSVVRRAAERLIVEGEFLHRVMTGIRRLADLEIGILRG